MFAESRRKESAFGALIYKYVQGAENWKIYGDTGFDGDRVWKKR